MTAIEVTNLRKAYGDHVAVHDLTFAVEPGEVFCLLGPNGAGKTTTTEVLEGYRDRSGGEVRVLGHDPARAERRYRERIGIVLQECGLQEDLTVAETLDLYGAYYPRRLPTERIIELVELDAKVDDRVGNLSGGQRRRLDVGLALVGDPELVFLDEPTTGFDPAARRHSWSVFRSLAELGKTILLTTHFMDEAEALADRIAVVSQGRIVAEGTPAELGGRDRAATTITTTLPAGTALADLPDLGGATVHLDGRQLTVEAADGTLAVHRLTGWALDAGHLLDDLAVQRPTLEDTYLALTQEATR
ncbi:MAG: ABC transporter ATP-binding protein [Acidimicrobiales bacterium]